MIYEVGLVIEVATAQRAAALRDKLANYLADDPNAELISWSASRVGRQWRVWGVDTSTSEPFEQLVAADSEDEARATYAAPKVVAAIQEVR